jgi:hypothetical protein
VIAVPPPDHQPTIEAVSRCGISASKIRIRFDQDIQEDVVLIAPLTEAAPAEVMHCVLETTSPSGYVVQFEDRQQNNAYWRLTFQEGRERARAEGRDWLRQHGFLDGLPRYSRGSELTTYLRAVEAHCRVEPGSALEAVGVDVATFRSDFMSRQLGEESDSGALICLNNVLAASDLAFGGVEFGILANAPRLESDHH